jgi:hypothetical protein
LLNLQDSGFDEDFSEDYNPFAPHGHDHAPQVEAPKEPEFPAAISSVLSAIPDKISLDIAPSEATETVAKAISDAAASIPGVAAILPQPEAAPVADAVASPPRPKSPDSANKSKAASSSLFGDEYDPFS